MSHIDSSSNGPDSDSGYLNSYDSTEDDSVYVSPVDGSSVSDYGAAADNAGLSSQALEEGAEQEDEDAYESLQEGSVVSEVDVDTDYANPFDDQSQHAQGLWDQLDFETEAILESIDDWGEGVDGEAFDFNQIPDSSDLLDAKEAFRDLSRGYHEHEETFYAPNVHAIKELNAELAVTERIDLVRKREIVTEVEYFTGRASDVAQEISALRQQAFDEYASTLMVGANGEHLPTYYAHDQLVVDWRNKARAYAQKREFCISALETIEGLQRLNRGV